MAGKKNRAPSRRPVFFLLPIRIERRLRHRVERSCDLRARANVARLHVVPCNYFLDPLWPLSRPIS